jgi:hypothetical protein
MNDRGKDPGAEILRRDPHRGHPSVSSSSLGTGYVAGSE